MSAFPSVDLAPNGDAKYDLLLGRTREALARHGIRQALLSSPETIANLVGEIFPCEDWPVADPFTAAPTLLFIGERRVCLIVSTLYLPSAARHGVEVVETLTYRWRGAPFDPYPELARVLTSLPWSSGPVGVEGRSLPARTAELVRAHCSELRWVDEILVCARRVKGPVEVDAVRSASRIADLIQRTVKERAEAGQSEVELAMIAHAAACTALGHRVPVLLSIDAGVESARGSSMPSARTLRKGDLVLTDTSPWVGGAWSDSANTIVLGPPTSAHQRRFDALRRSLELAIGLCRPGASGGEIDAGVRASLDRWGGEVYPHHTGHGLGASWNEPPRIVPGSREQIEEGMVVAIEPGLYRPGWGGMRLEHVFLVGPDGNQILTEFEHTL
jgi:Xaa-Pro aminopeptidase